MRGLPWLQRGHVNALAVALGGCACGQTVESPAAPRNEAVEPRDASDEEAQDATPSRNPGFTLALNSAPAPDRSAWLASGFALSGDGRRHAIAWTYEDVSDPISGFSGAVDIWDVETQTLRQTVEGIPGGVCYPDGGEKGCLAWLASDRLGLGFNTNAVGVLSLDEERLIFGVGDPTGTDSQRPWCRAADDLWVVGFHAHYRSLGTGPAISLWRPSDGSLTAFFPEGERWGWGLGPCTPLAPGTVLAVQADVLALLNPPRARSVRVPQVARDLRLRGGLGGRPVAYAQVTRNHVAPTREWVISDQADGLWLLGPDLHPVRKLAPFDPKLVPASFAWSPNGRYFAVSMRALNGTDGHVRWWDLEESSPPRTLPISARCERGVSGGHNSYAQPIAARDDGVLAVLQDRQVRFVNAETGPNSEPLAVRRGTIHLAFATGLTLLAAGEGFVSYIASPR